MGEQFVDDQNTGRGGADLLPLGKPIVLKKFVKTHDKGHRHGSNSPISSMIKQDKIPESYLESPSPKKAEDAKECSQDRAAEEN